MTSKHEEPMQLQSEENDTHQDTSTSFQQIIISSIGKIGRWQCFMIVAVLVPEMFLCWSLVSVSFTFGKTDWWKGTITMDPKSMVCMEIQLRRLKMAKYSFTYLKGTNFCGN